MAWIAEYDGTDWPAQNYGDYNRWSIIHAHPYNFPSWKDSVLPLSPLKGDLPQTLRAIKSNRCTLS